MQHYLQGGTVVKDRTMAGVEFPAMRSLVLVLVTHRGAAVGMEVSPVVGRRRGGAAAPRSFMLSFERLDYGSEGIDLAGADHHVCKSPAFPPLVQCFDDLSDRADQDVRAFADEVEINFKFLC